MKTTLSALTIAFALVAGAATVSAMPSHHDDFDYDTVFDPGN